MSTWFDGKENSSNQQLPSASRTAAIRSIHKERTKGYNANWTKTTPNRTKIKINSHADRHIHAFLQLQAASCAAQLLFWPLRLTVRPPPHLHKQEPRRSWLGYWRRTQKNIHAKSQRTHARDYRNSKVSEVARITPLSWQTITATSFRLPDWW